MKNISDKKNEKIPKVIPFGMENQPPPHDIQLEKVVLGSMLFEEEARNIAVGKISGADVFYYPIHQKVFSTIVKQMEGKKKHIDILTVNSALSKENVLDAVGGEEYLLEMQSAVVSTASIEHWCDILTNLSSLRKMIATCFSVIGKCYQAETENMEELFTEIESKVLEVRNVNTPVGETKVKEHIRSAVEYLEALHEGKTEATGISTGLPNLDRVIIGLKKQEMVVIAARPSIGKTALALNIASHIALVKKKTVAFFSLEMSPEELTLRLLCSQADISKNDFYEKRLTDGEFGAKWSKMTYAAKELQDANFFIDPTPALNIYELRAKAMRLHKKYKLDVIMIDYLQLMRADVSKNDNRQVEVSKISVGIKALAKELDLPIVVLAQLNRQAEQQDKPRLSHLRESGAIEQDADIVMFLHRDRDPQKDTALESVEAELIVEKNRNGQTGLANLVFFPKTMTFRSASRYNE